jgi:PAS domain S-box-containing protein
MSEAELSSELEALLNSKESAAVVDAILGNTPSGASLVSADGKILRFSEYAAQLLGRPRSTVEGRTQDQPVYDGSGRPLPDEERPLARALSGETVTGIEFWLETPDGERIPCLGNAAPIRNARGDLIGAISSFADLRPYKALEQSLREALAQRQEALAQREDALAQREALYRELTHRVKNHLQIMTALVVMNAQNPALSTKDLADQMKGQIQTLAAVYRGMDRAGVGERIQAGALVEEVSRPYAAGAVSVDVAVAPPDLTLASEQAGPLGMLVNEAVCNSYKHAFKSHGGCIEVSLRRTEPGRLRLEVVDNGKGWGPSEPSHKSRGMDLMRTFAKQLHGELELSNRPEGGAVVAVELSEATEDAGAA